MFFFSFQSVCVSFWRHRSLRSKRAAGLVAGNPDANLFPGYPAVLLPVIPALNDFIPDLVVRHIEQTRFRFKINNMDWDSIT